MRFSESPFFFISTRGATEGRRNSNGRRTPSMRQQRSLARFVCFHTVVELMKVDSTPSDIERKPILGRTGVQL